MEYLAQVNWVNTANWVSCFGMLMLLIGPAKVVHSWRHRVVIIPWALILSVQVVDPLTDVIPDMAWPGALFNTALFITLLCNRRELWHMVRAKFDPLNAPRGRSSDAVSREVS